MTQSSHFSGFMPTEMFNKNIYEDVYYSIICKILRKSKRLPLGIWLNKLWYFYSLRYCSVIQRLREIYKYGCGKNPIIYYCLKCWKQRGIEQDQRPKKYIFFAFPLLNAYFQKKTENELKSHILNMVLTFLRILHKPICFPKSTNSLKS